MAFEQHFENEWARSERSWVMGLIRAGLTDDAIVDAIDDVEDRGAAMVFVRSIREELGR